MREFLQRRKDEKNDRLAKHDRMPHASSPQDGIKSHPAPDDLSVSLRAEMMPKSDIKPDMRRFRSSRLNPLKFRVTVIFLILAALGWLAYFGPGRPTLERLLDNLMQQVQPGAIATATDAIPKPPTDAATPTLRPVATRTPTPYPRASSTVTIIPATPTSELVVTQAGDCLDVLGITLADIGKTACIRGVIQSYESRSSGFYLAFSSEKGAMYWVSYDMTWTPAAEGLCVELTGEIMQIANSPVLVFGYQNQPQICLTP